MSRLLCALLLSLSLLSPGFAQAQDTAKAPNSVNPVPLELYLSRIGYKLHCHFTVEVRRTKDMTLPASRQTKFSPLEDAYVPEDMSVATIESLVTWLRQKFPLAAVTRDTENPAVVHLMDASLAEDKAYVLNQKIDFTYSGIVEELPIALGKQLEGRIDRQRASVLPFLYGDYNNTRINAKDRTVRQVLTDGLAVAKYKSLLWESKTFTVNEKPLTWVEYYGPANQPVHVIHIPLSLLKPKGN